MPYFLLLIVFRVCVVLYHVVLRYQLMMLLSCSLSIGYVALESLKRSYLIGIPNLLRSSGRNYFVSWGRNWL